MGHWPAIVPPYTRGLCIRCAASPLAAWTGGTANVAHLTLTNAPLVDAPPVAPAAPATSASPERLERRVATTRASGYALSAVLLMGCAIHAAAVGLPVIHSRGTMEWDPAHHTLWGVAIYQDLLHGQLLSAAYDSYRQIYWPFLHSWLIAGSMALFGPTVDAARFVSLFAWEALAGILALLAWRMTRQGVAALLVAGLWLSTPAAFFRFGTEAFTEATAMMVTGIAFLALDHAIARGGAAWGIAGAASMLAYFSKTDYGVLVLAASGVALLRESRRRNGQRLRHLATAFLAPVLTLGALWFLYLPKLPSTILALQNRPLGPPRLTAEGFAFHFHMLHEWSGGAILAWVALACVALTLARELSGKRAGHPLELPIGAYVVLALALHQLSQTKDEKHIVKLVPWLFLMMAVRLAAAGVPGTTLRLRAAALGAMLLVLVDARIAPSVAAPASAARYGTEEALAGILERLQPGRRHLIVGGFTELSPYETIGDILRSDLTARIEPDPLTLGHHPREWWNACMADQRSRHPWLAALEPEAPAGPVYEIVAIPPKRREDEPSDPDAVRKRFFADREPDRAFVVVLDPSSTWHRDEYVRYVVPGGPFVPYLEARGYRTTETMSYPRHGLRIVVMDRASAAPSLRG